MWRFKQFMPREQNGLEGRTIDIGNLKIQVRNVIAEGGFSCVYLARDLIHGSKHYALKHIICNDEESLKLVMKEVSVMKSLKAHPNVVTLYAHTIFDMGRTKEALLVMEYCEKSLVNVLENRGAGYFEEKQILAIFRDVCNAVFAMHCQSPPIAHRDLKAENLLLGSDELWKLCDFGSTSTNHKRFEKPEEMGVEEDIIRKHTTPAYRAPEMWDLFRRELISEKVDIWSLGCLLFRICYFRAAFDGESKLQILNGNYRIPDLPKYSTSLMDLIKDMLQSSPDARPDITQVWFRVNDLLPDVLQKSLPDRPPEMQELGADRAETGVTKHAEKSGPMPSRSPPPPPSATEPAQNASQQSLNSRAGSALGAFWTTEHANDSVFVGKTHSNVDEEPTSHSSSRHNRSHLDRLPISYDTSRPEEEIRNLHSVQWPGKSVNRPDNSHSKDCDFNFFQDESGQGMERPKVLKLESMPASQSDAFKAFVAEFKTSKVNPGTNSRQSGSEVLLEAEIGKLKEQLKQVNVEKAEITSKYEKLSAICRSQRQEIQELKQALAARTPAPNRDTSKNQTSVGIHPSTATVQQGKIEGSVWELHQGLFSQSSSNPDSKQWQAFVDDPVPQTTLTSNAPGSAVTRNGLQSKQAAEVAAHAWGFGTESFIAVPAASSQINISVLNSSQQSGRSKMECDSTSQPAGWAGF